MSLIKNFLFDLDGTIADSAPAILKSIRRALSENNVCIDETLITTDIIGPPLPQIVAKLDAHCPEEVTCKIAADFRRSYDSNPADGVCIFEGMRETLQQLTQQGKKCFIVTNKPIIPAQTLLEIFDLSRYFVEIYSPNVIPGKVLLKPEMIGLLLEKHQLRAEESLMIGDIIGDINAGLEAGVKTFAALWGYYPNKAEMKNKAEYFGEKPQDLLRL